MKSSRLFIIAGVVCVLALVFCIPARRLLGDDQGDAEKSTKLEAELSVLGLMPGDAFTQAEADKVKLFLDALPADQCQALARSLRFDQPAERAKILRKYIDMPAAQSAALLTKRNQATRTLEDLRLIDSATDQYAIETNKVSGMHPVWADLKNYLKSGTPLYNTGADVFGHAYGPFTVDSIPLVSPETFNALSDVADPSFWSPYR